MVGHFRGHFAPLYDVDAVDIRTLRTLVGEVFSPICAYCICVQVSHICVLRLKRSVLSVLMQCWCGS